MLGWLRDLTVARGREPLLASAAFRIEGLLWPTLATVEPGFDFDDHGRRGALAHAFSTPATTAEAGWRADDPLAGLLAACREVRETVSKGVPGDATELDRRVDRCRVSTTRPRAPAPRPERTEEAILVAVVLAALDAPAGARATLPVPRGSEVEHLIGATAAWPPRLRLAFRWVVGASKPVANAVVIEAGPSAPPCAPRTAMATWVVPWVASMRARPDRWATDWTIRGWDDVAERVAEERS